MSTMRASEARTRLSRLLDGVERGETILITRHGRTIARIVPEADVRRHEVDAAVAAIRTFAQRVQWPVPLSELLCARHEGHKH